MAESMLTKRALAQTLKELMRTQPFEKVGVNDICEACQVSRKTFYYHFSDKYALVEWIFQTEYIEMMKQASLDDRWAIVDALCRYLYQERAFYSKLMQFRGQNSFRQYFQDFLFNVVEQFVMPERSAIDTVADQRGITPETAQSFYTRFIADAILFSIFRWLNDGAERPPEEFVTLLHSTDELIYAQVHGMSGDQAE